MKIRIFYDDINHRIRRSKEVLKLIEKVIRNKNKTPGDLYFIITTDERLTEINREFLKKDTLTDVIAFDYSERNCIKGEVYISKDTVKRNGHNYKVSLRTEMVRVMIHGTLHLCGYKDRNEADRGIMKEEEDFWIMKLKEQENGFLL